MLLHFFYVITSSNTLRNWNSKIVWHRRWTHGLKILPLVSTRLRLTPGFQALFTPFYGNKARSISYKFYIQYDVVNNNFNTQVLRKVYLSFFIYCHHKLGKYFSRCGTSMYVYLHSWCLFLSLKCHKMNIYYRHIQYCVCMYVCVCCTKSGHTCYCFYIYVIGMQV